MEIFTDLAHLQFVKKIIGIQIVATFFILVYLIKTDKKWKFNCILKQFRNICFSYLDLYPNHWKLRRNIVQCTRYNSSKSDKIWYRKCSINLCSKILKISLPAMLHFIFNLDLSPVTLKTNKNQDLYTRYHNHQTNERYDVSLQNGLLEGIKKKSETRQRLPSV